MCWRRGKITLQAAPQKTGRSVALESEHQSFWTEDSEMATEVMTSLSIRRVSVWSTIFGNSIRRCGSGFYHRIHY